MKANAILVFLFVGLGGINAQVFNTIEKLPKVKEVNLYFVMDTLTVPVQDEAPGKLEEPISKIKNMRISGLPLESVVITSAFGRRVDPYTRSIKFHTGVDLLSYKSKVYSMLHGKVIQTGYDLFLGNYIKIQHGKYTAVYGHLSSLFVHKGYYVKPGLLIGITGNTGKSTGDHLHLGIKEGDKPINPLLFLKAISTAKSKEELLTILTETE